VDVGTLQASLASLAADKNVARLTELGGINALFKALGSDPVRGLDEKAVPAHEKKYGRNELPAGVFSRSAIVVASRARAALARVLSRAEFAPSVLSSAFLTSPLSPLVLVYARRGANTRRAVDSKGILTLFMEGFEDRTLQLLSGAAVLSLILGIRENPSTGWIEGAAILFAVIIVVFVTAINDYQKEKQVRFPAHGNKMSWNCKHHLALCIFCC
jgi:magnesium-transporting ATPase (P-type)